MNDAACLAGIELGGTKAIVVAAEGGRIIDRLSVPTSDPSTTLGALRDWLVARAATLQAIGIASFGPVRIDPTATDYGHILETPKPGWAGTDVIGPFAMLGLPIAIDTDVNAAALAEARWGGGQGLTNVTYVTVGTGVGGGSLVGHTTIKGRLHPEVGHLLLTRADGDVFPGSCRFRGGCVEGLISGPALAARFGADPATLGADDPRWIAPAHDLAAFLAALVHCYAPQRIFVGGGVTLGSPWLLDMAIDRLPDLLGGYYPDLDAANLRRMVTVPALGSDAGPLGAIAVAMTALAER